MVLGGALTKSGRKNSVFCTIPYGVMQETLFLLTSDNEFTIFIPQTFTDTFNVIVDTVSCIMHYSIDILSDVFGHYGGIIGLKVCFMQLTAYKVFILTDFLYLCGAFAINAFTKHT